MRFPEAPIQPSTTVATAAAKPTVSSTDRLRRRRSQSNASEDKGHEAKRDDEEEAKLSDDDVEGEEEEEEEEEEDKKKKRKGGVTARTRRVQKKLNREEETVPDSTSLPSPPGLCISCIARSSRGRGRGGVTGRRGRRGVRGGVGRGGDRRAASRLQSGGASCTCHLLDASRMPPPSSRRRNNESVERAGTPVSQRSSGTRASKTKTTPPNAAVSAGAASLASSSLAGSCAMMGNTGMCGSYIKGKEDGMGAVFKWINFRKRCEEIEPYRFAFERVPSLEPWYETFQRQDDGTEKVYEYFGSTGKFQSVEAGVVARRTRWLPSFLSLIVTGYRKLPYEMGPLPALGQNCCILNYKVIASRKSNRTASLQSSSSASMEPASPSAGKKSASRLSSSEVTTSATHSASAVNESDTKKLSPSSSLSSLPLKKRKLLLQEGGAGSGGSTLKTDGSSTGGAEVASHSGRIARLIAGGSERPRKSPREHASTLAILSLLQQQQHRKRAGTIKILTSPKKATTATATQTTTLHEQLLHQDADSNGEELSRSCSRASDRGSSRAGSSTGGGIKFDRPLFPDSNYVNSRTLCQELDAFLSDELKRVAGEGSRATLDGIVKQELADPDAADELLTDGGSLVQSKSDVPTLEHSAIEMPELDQELLPPPSVAQEGIAIERNALSVSKRDLLDVLQTVGTEPPLSLKLVQRCETVVKKIVQYDRKERSMLASGSGSGLAISSASPVIGLQLFDSGSSLAGCGPGTGVGSVGGSFLKKRINRTGWPTNKRKIGTRTRQQSRFMLPALAKKSLSRESVKKEEPDDGEAAESKDEHDASQQCVVKKHEDDEDTDEEEDEDDEEDDEAQEEEEDRSELVTAGKMDGVEDDEDDDALVKLKEKEKVSPARCMPRKDVAQATANEKTDCIRRKQQPSKEEEESTAKRSEPQSIERRRRKSSFGKSNEARKLNASKRGHLNKAPPGKQHTDDGEKKNEESEAEDVVKLASQEVVHEKSDEKERNTIAFDSMPTLRAALMRDNSQLQRSMASSMLLPSSPTKPTSISSLSMPGSLNRGTVPHGTGRATPAMGGCESLLCPASSPGASSGQVLGASCCKYITKTTTTMTRVDYDGGGNVTSSGSSHPPLKLKHSREDVSTTNEEEEQPHSHREDTRQKQSCVPNRYRGAASSSTAIGSAALTTTHDSDDKECDSISSRSIFVSDDCDTTSSSTAINPPDDRSPSTGELPSTTPGYSNHLPHTEPGAAASHSSDVTSSSSSLPMNPRLSTARVRRKESSDNEESVQTVAEATHNKRSSEKYVLVNKSSKSPRTPSERIRNKMVKNRRVAIRMATAAIEKQEATKPHDIQTAKTVPSSKRRKSSSLGPPLPPPTVMPLSPPLTTSTSSSSSSSYGADDKAPLSPVGVVTAVRRKTHTDDDIIIGDELLQDEQSAQHSSSANSVIEHNHNVGIALTPSKIKTRSSTFGHSPPKRTYGRATVSSKKLPFVSLVKTAFVPEGEIDAEATLVNGTKSPGNKKGNKRKRCGSSVEKKASNKSSLSMKKVLKKRPKPEQHVTATKRKQMQAAGVAGGLGGKSSKKLSARSKQAVARRKLQKSVEDAATSGHFNNNSDALANVANLEQGEEEDPLSTSHVQEHSIEQQQDHHGSEECNQRQHHHTTTRAHDLMEEHLIEEEEAEGEELLERNEGGDAVEEEDELDGVEEEEHYELLELMEVEEQAEEEEMGDVAEDEEEEETHQVEEEEEEEDAFLMREDVSQQQQQDDEERKLIMADHDYSDQQVDPALVDAEFVEVEELEEDDLECDEEEEMGEGEQEEVAEEEEEELEEDEAAHHHHDGDEDDDYNDDEEEEEDDDTTTISEDHPRRVTVAPSALSFDKQQRVKLSYASSSGASSALTITSSTTPKTVAASTSAATTKSFNSTTTTSSPTKYSPRKLRKPRGRWYRER
uniref:Uncharacterized protein n=1 Tax=Anopheles culicifacies TaxID=139723 RepID=A0A182MHN3_9DIPT